MRFLSPMPVGYLPTVKTHRLCCGTPVASPGANRTSARRPHTTADEHQVAGCLPHVYGMSRAVDEVRAHARTAEFGSLGGFEVSKLLSCVVVEVKKFTDELDDRILEYYLFWVSESITVFAYCMHNRFITHEQHSCDFCKLEKSLHCRNRASLVCAMVQEWQNCMLRTPGEFVLPYVGLLFIYLLTSI
jgi:hypothetical protein